MKRIMLLGPLSALLVLGSLLLPSSVPGRSATERLEHGLPIPFIRQTLAGHGYNGENLWAYSGPVLTPHRFPTEVSEAALLADIVIVGAGLWLVGGLWGRRRRRSTSNGQFDPGVRLPERRPCHQRAIYTGHDRSRADTHGQHHGPCAISPAPQVAILPVTNGEGMLQVGRPLAQAARTTPARRADYGPEGRGFESPRSPQIPRALVHGRQDVPVEVSLLVAGVASACLPWPEGCDLG